MTQAALLGKKSIRLAKNYTLGYSEIQSKVRNATSSDPLLPSSKDLDEITQSSYRPDDFMEIVGILGKRLGDKGRNWRHVQKSLMLSEHLLYHGPEAVVHYFKNNIHTVKTLREFQYIDDRGRDCGAQVRMKAKDITNVLTNPSILREKRRNRSIMGSDTLMARLNEAVDMQEQQNENVGRRDGSMVPPMAQDEANSREQNGDSHADLIRAMEESKRTAEGSGMTAEEQDIFRALELSLKEGEQARSIGPVIDNGSSSKEPTHIFTAESLNRDGADALLIDVSIPQSDLFPQLQYTPFSSPMSDVSSLQVSSPLAEQMYTNTSALAPPHVQLSPIQPQAYSPPPASRPVQNPVYRSNNPFAPSGSSFTFLPPPSLVSPQSIYSTSQLPPVQHHDLLLSSNISAGPLSASPTQSLSPISQQKQINQPISLPRLFPPNVHLAELLTTHSHGVDTFGNAGQLRYGAGASGGAGPTVRSNNPFANMA